MDLTKAFDLVNKSQLLRKLDTKGVHDVENYWISSYITGRDPFPIIEERCQSVLSIERGVIQGSFFVPLDFLTFRNDVCK